MSVLQAEMHTLSWRYPLAAQLIKYIIYQHSVSMRALLELFVDWVVVLYLGRSYFHDLFSIALNNSRW